MNQIKNLALDKRGSTLIEIIISVLIVGIAFVPLMISLNGTLVANRQTENELYAENVASSVAEICKSYGAAGLQKFSDGEEHISDIFSSASLTGTAPEFTITGIASGIDKVYSVDIRFDKSPYETKPSDPTGTVRQNDYTGYPSISAIHDAVSVNFGNEKIGNLLGTDESAADRFWKQAKASGTSVTREEMMANVSNWLERTINVKVSFQAAAGENPAQYIVEKSIVYSVSKTATVDGSVYSADNDKRIFGNSGYTPDSITTQEYDEPATYTAVPSNVILTYKPVTDDAGNAIKLKSEKLVINKQIDDVINVYSLIEGGSSKTGWTISASHTSDSKNPGTSPNYNIRVYSNISLTTTSVKKLSKFGEGAVSAQNKMKDVTITVKDESGNEVVQKKITVIELENE